MYIDKQILTRSPFSRSGRELKYVAGIVIHYIGNPNTSAMQNRNYFETLKNQSESNPNARYASAHYIIGLTGEIIQCVPECEMAYHVGAKKYTELAMKKLSSYPNDCTIGIELCHPDFTGEFKIETLESAHYLVDYLLEVYDLNSENVYRHYDITEKECPLYFVKKPEAWSDFIEKIKSNKK